jgi:LuxR family transcriptional regulator, maltose regulon positive regulatory protein
MVTSAAMPAPASTARQTAGAGDPLLISKITVPGVPGWLVSRPRLDKLIAEGTQNTVTTITGPPGAGKTMALALWASASAPAGPIAWVTLDDYDNRPRAFWSYVLAALRQAGVPVPRAMSATARRYALDHEFLLRCASLVAAQDPPVTLVLDDVHLLTAPKVLDGLAYVLRHAGPGLRLIAASRMDPLLPLHRYRLSGELTEIRASELAFTVPEARLLVAQHGITLSAESLERLTRRAEGWPAIMRLAAISMDGHDDPEQFVKGLITEDSAVTGYLVEEVLNAQPADVREFLLRTSILDRINENVAAELTGSGPDRTVLADLVRAKALVQRDEGGWYRCHSLFTAVLRLKLRREHPDQVADLHMRAASWHRRNGFLAEAVRHAGAAGDWQFAARAVLDELAVDRLIYPGNEPLTGSFRQMPRGQSWTEPQPLLVAAAIDFARAQDAASECFLTAAEDMLESLPAGDEIPSRLAASMIRLALSRRTGDLSAAAAAAEKAQVLLEDVPTEQLARHPWIQARVLAGRGAIELWSGHLDEASAIFEAVLATQDAPERERADCLGHLALIETLRGRLTRAAELAADATGRPDDDDSADRSGGGASQAAEVALASIHMERNERSRSRRWLKRALDALRTRPDKLVGVVAHLVAARHSLAEGHGQAALEIISHARQGWTPPAWAEHRLTVLQSQSCTATADLRSAIDLAEQAGPAFSLDAAVALARALLAAEDPEAARNALDAAPPGEEPPDGVLLESLMADAQLSYESGDRARGRRCLERALRLSEREQFRLQFSMERGWLRPVLRREPDLAQSYRRVLEPELVGPAAAGARQPGVAEAVPVIVEKLSEREREVLEHVSAMESTAEIASEMYISVNTVKTHLKSIYRKLSVTHRGEAVRRARQFGLL